MGVIRVLQVVTIMNRGGLETMLMNYYRNIDRNKVQFDFLVHREGEHDFTEEILSLGGKVHVVPPMNPLNTNGYFEELNRFFKKNDYKIIHSHIDTMSTYPLKYAKKNDIPIRIAHSHNTNLEKNLKIFLKLYSRTKIKNYTTHLFACGKEAGKWLFRNEDFKILNNAIDLNKYSYNEETSKQYKTEMEINNSLVVGHIGRFNKQKNHNFLIDIFAEINKKNKNSILLLIGVGELEEEIKKKVNKLGLNSKVKFLGLRDDIPLLLNAIDVFVFPSLFEGLPVTLVEAQANGLPCVVSNKITDEIALIPSIKFIGLDTKAEVWADEILKIDYKSNRNTENRILLNDFDIEKNAYWLQEFYLDKYKSIVNQ